MKRFKLFITALLAGCTLSMNAAEWTGDAVTDGTFYLYNVGTGKFLSAGDPTADYGTRGWLTKSYGIDVTLAASGDGYTIDSKIFRDGKLDSKIHFMGNNSYLDSDATPFTFTKVGDANIYTISSENKYLTGTDSKIDFTTATNDDSQKWQLISRDELLKAMENATKTSPMDVTFLIKTPDFARGDVERVKNWKEPDNKGAIIVSCANETPNPRTDRYYGCEFYGNIFNFNQTLTGIPAGVYELTVQGFGTQGTTILYAGITEKPFANTTPSVNNLRAALNAFANGEYTGNTTGKFAHTGGDLTIGIKRTTENSNHWTAFDNFQLTYYGIDMEAYATELNAAITTAEAINTETLTTACATALAKAISDHKDKSYSTVDEYTAAINAVKEAIETAKANAAQYAIFNDTKAIVESIIAQEDVYTDKDNAKNTAKNNITNIVTETNTCIEASGIKDNEAKLLPIAKTFIAAVDINDEKCFDITTLIANPSFDNNATDGWTYNEAPGYNSTGKNAEYYEKDFDFNQTLTGMPKGNYKLKVQAFQRPGSNDAAYTAWKAGTDVIDTYIYINEGQTKVKNVMSEYSDVALAGDEATAGYKAWIDYKDAEGHWHPNGMPGAALYFDKGMYDNEILTSVEGDLKLGFKGKKATAAWTLFDNFRLYYYGTSIPVTIDEANDFSVANDVENAKVTLNRTIKADVWNTIVLPFDLTDGETKAAFGNDAQVATFSENSDDAQNATVSFNIATSAAIEANVPVLLKTATAGTEYTFTGRTIKALNGTTPKVAGSNFSFTGTYTATCTVPENDYFISSSKLYRSEGSTTLKGTRAYIAANEATSGAKIARFSIGGNEATAIDGVLVEKNGNAAVYNMAGQRVAADKLAKGVYILNNKKIIVK